MALIPRPSSYSPFLLRNPSLPLVITHVFPSPVKSLTRVNSAFSCTWFSKNKGTYTAAPSAETEPPTLDNAADLNFGRMAFSDVKVRRRRKVYWGRKWNLQDMSRAAVAMMVHLLWLAAPFTFTWLAFWVAVAIGAAAGFLGITLCYHRCLTHKSFKLPKWLEYLFAY